jgi:predicted CopG family antitoxin
MGKTTIQVADDVKRRLQVEKARRGASSYNEALRDMLDEQGNGGML